MIHPNKHINLFHLKVIILGNERTACACEMFINFMQTNHNALLVSNNQTGGSYASIFEISFPSGFSCKINGLAKLFTPENKVIETKGIQPDIYVQLNKVHDLAPYNDKILQTAISVLNASFPSPNDKKGSINF
jgi:C-terminal processing protease CtpA/Prc